MNLVLIGILSYIVLQLLLGILVSRRIRTEADYLLAGRRLGYGLATFSIFATWFGGVRSAVAALMIGTTVWFISHYAFHFQLSYIFALGSAFFSYVVVAYGERWVPALMQSKTPVSEREG